MAAGSVTFTTWPRQRCRRWSYVFPTNLNPAVLMTGNNVLAVEVHQSATTSSDVSFDFELIGNPSPL